MKPLCQCFQLMVQFHLNTLSFFLFFSTFCICKHHFCNISFVVHCHCILYTCPIHCQQPLVCMISPSIFPLFFGTKVKLNWVDQLCSLCALISSTYPLWDNKINTQERLSALQQLTVLHFSGGPRKLRRQGLCIAPYTARTPLKSVPELFPGTPRNWHIATIIDVCFHQIIVLLWFDQYKSGHVTGTHVN